MHKQLDQKDVNKVDLQLQLHLQGWRGVNLGTGQVPVSAWFCTVER